MKIAKEERLAKGLEYVRELDRNRIPNPAEAEMAMGPSYEVYELLRLFGGGIAKAVDRFMAAHDWLRCDDLTCSLSEQTGFSHGDFQTQVTAALALSFIHRRARLARQLWWTSEGDRRVLEAIGCPRAHEIAERDWRLWVHAPVPEGFTWENGVSLPTAQPPAGAEMADG
jgi:hypothetical protein